MGIKKGPSHGLPQAAGTFVHAKNGQGKTAQWGTPDVVDGAAHCLCMQLHALPAAHVHMDSLRVLLRGCTSRLLASVFKRLEQKRSSHRAFEVFGLLRSLPPEDPLSALCDQYTYSVMMSQCTRPKGHKAALKMLSEMRERGIERNLHTFTSLMSVCLHGDKPETALQLYSDLLAEGLVPCLATYHTLMDVYGHLGQWEKSIEILDGIISSGMEADVRTYNIAIIACGRCNNVQGSIRVFERLLDSGIRPCVTTYTSLMSIFCRDGHLEEAQLLLSAMQTGGIQPNVITYSTLINGHATAGDLQGALLIFEKMRERKCQPSVVTYNTLLKACAPEGDWRTAQRLWSHMHSVACRPDLVSFRAFLSVMHASARWAALLRVFLQEQHAELGNCRIIVEKVLETLWCTGSWDAQVCALQLFQQSDAVTIEPCRTAPNAPIDLVWHAKVHLPGAALCMLLSWLHMLTRFAWPLEHRAPLIPPPPPLGMPRPREHGRATNLEMRALELAVELKKSAALRRGVTGPQRAAVLLASSQALPPSGQQVWDSCASQPANGLLDACSSGLSSGEAHLPSASSMSNTLSPNAPPAWPAARNHSSSDPCNYLPHPTAMMESLFSSVRNNALVPPPPPDLLGMYGPGSASSSQSYNTAPESIAPHAGPALVQLRLKLSKLGEQPLDTMVEQVQEEVQRLQAPLQLQLDGHLLLISCPIDEMQRWLATASARSVLELPSCAAKRPPLVPPPGDRDAGLRMHAYFERVLNRQQSQEAAIRTAVALESKHYPFVPSRVSLTTVTHAVAALQRVFPDTLDAVYWTAQHVLLMCLLSRECALATIFSTRARAHIASAAGSHPPSAAGEARSAKCDISALLSALPLSLGDGDDSASGSGLNSTVPSHMPSFDMVYRARAPGGGSLCLRKESSRQRQASLGPVSGANLVPVATHSAAAQRTASSAPATRTHSRPGQPEDDSAAVFAEQLSARLEACAAPALEHPPSFATSPLDPGPSLPPLLAQPHKAGGRDPIVEPPSSAQSCGVIGGPVSCCSTTLSMMSNELGSSFESNELADPWASMSGHSRGLGPLSVGASPPQSPRIASWTIAPPPKGGPPAPSPLSAHVRFCPSVGSASSGVSPKGVMSAHAVSAPLSHDGRRCVSEQTNALTPDAAFAAPPGLGYFSAAKQPTWPISASGLDGAAPSRPAAPRSQPASQPSPMPVSPGARSLSSCDGASAPKSAPGDAPGDNNGGKDVESLAHVCALIGVALTTGEAVFDTLPKQWQDADQELLVDALERVSKTPMGNSLWGFCEQYLAVLSPEGPTAAGEQMRTFVRTHITTVGQHEVLLFQPPSLLAAALVTLARAQLHLWPEWPQALVAMTGYALTQAAADAPAEQSRGGASALLTTTAAVAELLGLPPFTPSKYELGRAVGPDRVLNRLANVARPEHDASATGYLVSVLQKAALC